jgi:antitoxin component HigA of HigAB toxin-antitoxin module
VTASDDDARMETRSLDPTGILIVRVWIEANVRDGLRARITQTLDSTLDEQTMTTAGNPEDICAVVRTWVEAFVDRDRVTDLTTDIGAADTR